MAEMQNPNTDGDSTVLCGANSYVEKYYLNEQFSGLPESIKQELQIMCVLYTADVGGVLLLVFDENGKAVYSSVDKKQEEVFRPYLVRVEISDLNIRKKPGTDQEKVGKYTGVGCFTIVAEADGVGASKWGLLKAYEKERNGWISLDFVTRI